MSLSLSLSLCVSPSVLDMARHVPLYRALLELLRAISTCTSLVPLLLPLSGDPGEEEEEEHSECQTSVGMLLAKMKTCVDTYTNRLRSDRWYAHTDLRRAHTYTHTHTQTYTHHLGLGSTLTALHIVL